MSDKAIAALIFGVAVLIAVFALGLLRWRMAKLKRQVAAARSWPTVPGRVTGGWIVERRFSRGVSYSAVIAYDYEVAGHRYRSHRYSLSGPHNFSFHSRALRLLNRLPVGAAVTVSYDPAAPGEGVISVSAPQVTTLSIIFWVCLLVFGWLLGGLLLFEPLLTDNPLIRL